MILKAPTNRCYIFDMKRRLCMVLDASRVGKIQVIETTWDHLTWFLGCAPLPPIIQERFCIELQEDDHLAASSLTRGDQESGTHAYSKNSTVKVTLLSNSHCLEIEEHYLHIIP